VFVADPGPSSDEAKTAAQASVDKFALDM
jgi:oligoribonuclease